MHETGTAQIPFKHGITCMAWVRDGQGPEDVHPRASSGSAGYIRRHRSGIAVSNAPAAMMQPNWQTSIEESRTRAGNSPPDALRFMARRGWPLTNCSLASYCPRYQVPYGGPRRRLPQLLQKHAGTPRAYDDPCSAKIKIVGAAQGSGAVSPGRQMPEATVNDRTSLRA